MKILITSGGTKVPVDSVRDVTNKSKGTFGSKIATEALKANHKVIFMRAEGSKSPMSITFDFNKTPEIYLDNHQKALMEAYHFAWVHLGRYSERKFVYYHDYALQLKEIITREKPDVVVLAGAVSDYLVKEPVIGKIRSKEDLTIELEHAEKLISKVKEWHPECILVGFKMLFKSTFDELANACLDSMDKNNCDLVVGNDYLSLVEGRHQIMLFTKGAKE